jgi:two-component system alkaline phosphatase synthesis response regulator PhoP
VWLPLSSLLVYNYNPMKKTILVVDDEPKIVKVVSDYLERAGYRVVTAGDGQMALTIARHERPSLVILDLMLPAIDGLDVCQRLRQEPLTADVPIIMLTARVDETERVVGLELGADDYVTKPFSPRELLARVRAVLRRTEGERSPSALLRVGDLTIDPARRSVLVGERPVELTPTEFDLLAVLARHPGQPFTREQLLDLVYDVAYAGYDRTIDAHIKNLRRKLEADSRNPRYILTVHGVGYKLDEPD